MKRLVVLSAVLFLCVAMTPLSFAQGTGGMDMGKDSGKKSQAKTHTAFGTVTKVDPASSKVTIAHGPVQTLNWSAMTMTFTVKDKALLGKLPSGKKVEFEFVQQGRDYVIVSAK
jgi:Cu(I)/Ag(I) efflux system periplasmic protein CusF